MDIRLSYGQWDVSVQDIQEILQEEVCLSTSLPGFYNVDMLWRAQVAILNYEA